MNYIGIVVIIITKTDEIKKLQRYELMDSMNNTQKSAKLTFHAFNPNFINELTAESIGKKCQRRDGFGEHETC